MAIKETIKNISPPWLCSGNAEKFMYVLGLILDVQVQRIQDVIIARMPSKTYNFIPDALSQLGNDRGIIRGINETNQAYGVRLSRAFTDWHYAGLPRAILSQISGWLYPKLPIIKNVDNLGQWYYYNDNSDITKQPLYTRTAPWNWDNENRIWRFWTIINNVGTNKWVNSITYGSGKKWGDSTISWGFDIPSTYQTSMKRIISAFKPAHSYCENIIVAFDASKFNPDNNTTYPTDGKWGNYGKLNDEGIYVPSRETTARYIKGQ